ncbi:hypothetical protein HPB48_003234 [Haemaphysalis longicornis]|uniref:Uncharacterized protein n=1 Tax=Haemaphysalis longicornis TaxID=44386 RepID=A0A9J6GCF6_HAELO|nr:hypothetical protein HPB48_003234 [Haemaphysalis longicornis]
MSSGKQNDKRVLVTRQLLRSAQEATRHLMVDKSAPTTVKHLPNVWTTRESLHKAYLAHGRQYRDLLRGRNKTAQAC